MHFVETLHHNLRTVAMPSAMVVGALLCRPVSALEAWSGHMITPGLIFAMLFVTFCRVSVRDLRLSWLHGLLLLFQFGVSTAVYFALRPFDVIVAQGAMICTLAPVAMAAVVIAGMLGANVATALVAPVILNFTGSGACSFGQIIARIGPLLIGPFVVAQLCRLVVPRFAGWVGQHGQISFYLWLVSLIVIIGRTTAFIIDLHDVSRSVELWLALVALVLCLTQFTIGRALGRHFGDPPAGGQSLGQKNTVLAIWMSQSFLHPVSSLAPTAYIVWQNFVNSFQLYRKDSDK